MSRFLPAVVVLFFANPLPAADTVVLAHGADEKLVTPFGVEFGQDGTLYFVEMAKGERLRKVVNGTVVTVSGTGAKGDTGDGKKGLTATFNGMHSLAIDGDGLIYLADTWNNRIRTFDPKKGEVSKFAGTGEKGFAGDGGPADDAKFGGVFCVSFDKPKANLYVTDLDNRRVRKIELKKRIVTTVAGNGSKGVPKDGKKATEQPLVDPRAAAVDGKGRLYVLERGGHALRVVEEDGTIRTVAGTGKAGADGIGGPALKAAMNGPKHLCVDADDSVLIADTENHRVVRYVPKTEKLELVAGTGKKGSGGVGGDPLKVELSQPHGVTVQPKTGVLFITDSYNNRILKILK
jgi:sugar lactone lactonase YvrE